MLEHPDILLQLFDAAAAHQDRGDRRVAKRELHRRRRYSAETLTSPLR
jgi:hypothetical protein